MIKRIFAGHFINKPGLYGIPREDQLVYAFNWSLARLFYESRGRHNPYGLAGSANSFARADHVHNISVSSGPNAHSHTHTP